MTNKATQTGKEPAFSTMYFRQNGNASEYCPFEVDTSSGLTKREYFAAKALQGLLADSELDTFGVKDFAEKSVRYADALLEELSKTE